VQVLRLRSLRHASRTRTKSQVQRTKQLVASSPSCRSVRRTGAGPPAHRSRDISQPLSAAEDCRGPAGLAETKRAEDCRGSRGSVIAHGGLGSMPPRHGCEAAVAIFRDPGSVETRGKIATTLTCLAMTEDEAASRHFCPSLRTLCLLAGAVGWLMHWGRYRRGMAAKRPWQSRQDPWQSQAQAGVCQNKHRFLACRIHRSSRAERTTRPRLGDVTYY
jgi:hypothetical protein